MKPPVIFHCGGSHPEVLRAVELGLGVLGGGEQWLPPVVVGVAGAVQTVTAIELVPDGAILVPSGVALGLENRVPAAAPLGRYVCCSLSAGRR
jgi:hypothetical protein